MHRRHFIAIASILSKQLEAEQQGYAFDIVEAFASFLEAESSQFDKLKFIKLCEAKKFCIDCGEPLNDKMCISCKKIRCLKCCKNR